MLARPTLKMGARALRALRFCHYPGALLVLVLLGACLPTTPIRTPSQTFRTGEVLTLDTFDTPGTWQTYDSPQVRLNVVNGVYRAEISTPAYVWGLNRALHADAIIESDAFLLTDGRRDSAYGIICRGDPANDGDGYYFLIAGDGTFSIRRGRGNEVEALIAWEHTPAVRQGIAQNRLQAVCIGDYLALYVNGQFVAETRDTLYTQGYAGVAVVALQNARIIAEFDRFTVSAGELIAR